jgi:hypothetical protein
VCSSFGVISFLSYDQQTVYNANTLAGLVEQKKGLQNWLVYYENQHAKNPAKKPTMKVRVVCCRFILMDPKLFNLLV